MAPAERIGDAARGGASNLSCRSSPCTNGTSGHFDQRAADHQVLLDLSILDPRRWHAMPLRNPAGSRFRLDACIDQQPPVGRLRRTVGRRGRQQPGVVAHALSHMILERTAPVSRRQTRANTREAATPGVRCRLPRRPRLLLGLRRSTRSALFAVLHRQSGSSPSASSRTASSRPSRSRLVTRGEAESRAAREAVRERRCGGPSGDQRRSVRACQQWRTQWETWLPRFGRPDSGTPCACGVRLLCVRSKSEISDDRQESTTSPRLQIRYRKRSASMPGPPIGDGTHVRSVGPMFARRGGRGVLG